MKRRRNLILAAAVVVMAGMFFLWPRGPREPVYQGKTLTQWVNEAIGNGILGKNDETQAAIKAIGTNTLPFLLKEFTRPVSRWRGRLAARVNGQPYLKIHLRTDEERINTAGWGLYLLGTNVAPALPVLAGHMNDPLRISFVTALFRNTGQSALPHLTAAASSRDPVTASNAVATTQGLGYPSYQTREVYAVALRHPDAGVRAKAVEGWSIADSRTHDVVADLLKLAHDPSLRVVPEVSNQLVRLSGHGPPDLRPAASNALLTLRTNAPAPRTN
jgi:hypothetical protein